MSDIIFYALAVFFMGFGMISFSMYIIDFFYETKYLKNKKLYTFFLTKNEVCTVENVARAVIFKIHKSSSGICDHEIFAIDDNSDDGTYTILKKMSESEKKIKIIKNDEAVKKVLNNIKMWFFCQKSFTNQTKCDIIVMLNKDVFMF